MPTNSIYSGPITTSTFSAMRFEPVPDTCQCETEDKKAGRCQILDFDRLFSSDIMAMKGLT